MEKERVLAYALAQPIDDAQLDQVAGGTAAGSGARTSSVIITGNSMCPDVIIG